MEHYIIITFPVIGKGMFLCMGGVNNASQNAHTKNAARLKFVWLSQNAPLADSKCPSYNGRAFCLSSWKAILTQPDKLQCISEGDGAF